MTESWVPPPAIPGQAHTIFIYIAITLVVLGLAVGVPYFWNTCSGFRGQLRIMDEDLSQLHEELNGLSTIVSKLDGDVRTELEGTLRTIASSKSTTLELSRFEQAPLYVTATYQGTKSIAEEIWARITTASVDLKVEYTVGDQPPRQGPTLNACRANILQGHGHGPMTIEICFVIGKLQVHNNRIHQMCRVEKVQSLHIATVHATDLKSSEDRVVPLLETVIVPFVYETPDAASIRSITVTPLRFTGYMLEGDDLVLHPMDGSHFEPQTVYQSMHPWDICVK